jgi:hypothetical protein
MTPKNTPRRNFLLSLAGLSAAAAIPSFTACTNQSEPKLSSAPKPAKAAKQPRPLRIVIQGSWAIFVGKKDISVYAPDVSTHSYQVSDGPYNACDFGKFLVNLILFGTNVDLDFTGGIDGAGSPPKFDTSGTNIIDTSINPVLAAGDVQRPGSGAYLYKILLPLPDRVSSECLALKEYGNHGDFFEKPLLKLRDLCRVHVFEYDNYDPANVNINNKVVFQFASGEERLKILSEPNNVTAAIDKCSKDHIQEANNALGKMLNVKDGIKLSEKYCFHTAGGAPTALMLSKLKKDDGGVDPHSRIPACMSMLINDTGTAAVSAKRGSK